MKIGVVGKGGVGKTTVSALLGRSLAARGRRVLAVDTDSNPNLGLSLGLDAVQTEALPTVPRSIVVGTRGDLTVGELMADYAAETPSGVTVMSALRVTEAAAGCTCGGHATVRSLLGEALETETDDTIVDMEAGIEHLSRSGGTLAHADVLVLVMEPSLKAVITARRTIALARELGIGAWLGVGNKVSRRPAGPAGPPVRRQRRAPRRGDPGQPGRHRSGPHGHPAGACRSRRRVACGRIPDRPALGAGQRARAVVAGPLPA